ncbi:MAG: hydrolase [Rhodospirillales bacterium]|nr:hydrolase [Rhodospirillales bacterium]
MLIEPDKSCLIVIDMQERLVPAMQAPARTIKNAATLMKAATCLSVPTVLTEQYPKGLGHTVPELLKLADGMKVMEKLHFSCMKDINFSTYFKSLGRKQAVIAGMEAHICVLQTGMTLMEQGYEIFVVTDATSSRTPESEKACLDRLSAAGAGIVTTEMVVFEWLGQAATPQFKELLPLMK